MSNPSLPTYDPVHDVYRYERNPLDSIFCPSNIALIGATEAPGSVGRTIMWNLISNPFGGAVFPVNPKRPSVLGVKAYPDIYSVPEPVELAVIVTPAYTVPKVIAECSTAGVKGAIIISAGFKETGKQGAELERQVLGHARRGNMRIIGPNCLGVMNPISGLNATFAAAMAHRGNVGFISQSGALCTAVLDWSLKENVGFSSFVSIGSMLDIGWGDLIYYLGDDPNTTSIVIYMETVGDARSFLSAAREVANTKPIIVIKPGRTEGAAKAAASHTGSLTGSDEVLEVAFRRAGVLRVNTIAELFYMAEVLSKQPLPNGNRLIVLTNAGGPGVLAADSLITNNGQLAQLSLESMQAFNQLLPTAWSHNNPVDILGDASPERYAKALEIASQNPESDGMLVILTPQDMTDPTKTAEQVVASAQNMKKPILASWMGGTGIEEGEQILNRANIPSFPYPDTATRMFTYMASYAGILRRLYETPTLDAYKFDRLPDSQAVNKIIQSVRTCGRTLLTEYESKLLLEAYHIPTVETHIALDEEEAVEISNRIGYPIVLKLHSETITHKTDVGGVKLGLNNENEVRQGFCEIAKNVKTRAGEKTKDGSMNFLGVTVQPMVDLEGYELILGSSVDPQFGPVILFGLGGQLVEVFRDSSLALPPLNSNLATRMMEHTKIFSALKGVRGRAPIHLASLERLIVRFSTLICEQPWIKEIDINPLIVSPKNILALDARVLVYGSKVSEKELPKLAIRPYPVQYVKEWRAKDGTPISIRPIRSEDEPLMVDFHKSLSDRSVYLRFMYPMSLVERISHERLSRICHADYAREITMVADKYQAKPGELRILGAARLRKILGTNRARFGVLISDTSQGIGLGKELLRNLIDVARNERLQFIESLMSPDNQVMKKMCEDLGFTVKPEEKDMLKAEIELRI